MSTSVSHRGNSLRPTKARTAPAARRGKSALPPVELYSDERIAEFLLNNAVDARDYLRACADARKLGIDPEKVRHYKPPGRSSLAGKRCSQKRTEPAD